METASEPKASGGGGVATSNKGNDGGVVRGINASNKGNGVSDAASVGAGDASSVAVGTGKASFVPKTNSSIALPSGLRFSVLASALPQFPQQSLLFSRI